MSEPTIQLRFAISSVIVVAAVLVATFGVIKETAATTTNCENQQGSVVQELAVPSEKAAGVTTTALSLGQSYVLLVTGEFEYDRNGSTADGRQLVIDNFRPSFGGSGTDKTYCVELRGAGDPVELRIQDVQHADNSGSLSVVVVLKD